VDIAGNNSGTLQNGATYGNGEVGQAFNFAGSGAAVLVNSPVYSPAAGTLMLWFMPTAAGSLTGSYDGTNRTPGLAVDANGNLTWEFGNLSAQPLGQIAFNQWSHAAMTLFRFQFGSRREGVFEWESGRERDCISELFLVSAICYWRLFGRATSIVLRLDGRSCDLQTRR